MFVLRLHNAHVLLRSDFALCIALKQSRCLKNLHTHTHAVCTLFSATSSLVLSSLTIRSIFQPFGLDFNLRHNKIGTFVSRTASIENSKSISSHIYEQSSTNGSDGYEPSAENVFKTIHHFDQHSFGNNHCDHHSTNECSVCLFSISLKLKLEIIHMNRLHHTLTHRSTDRPTKGAHSNTL